VHPKRAFVRFEVKHSAEARIASDHLPVRAELSVVAAPDASQRNVGDLFG
jgi:endonuclease/exonuclease/phosphatase family metal-dependent hydrolase